MAVLSQFISTTAACALVVTALAGGARADDLVGSIVKAPVVPDGDVADARPI